MEIGDDVTIGANSTIARGFVAIEQHWVCPSGDDLIQSTHAPTHVCRSWRNTVIGAGCKLDNLVQIGHNVVMGPHCVVAAQSGIAGSVTVGTHAYMGGQVGIAQHLTVGDHVRIAGKAGVMADVPSRAAVGALNGWVRMGCLPCPGVIVVDARPRCTTCR